jgi:hypothetical protein
MDEPGSNFAFNFKSRRFIKAWDAVHDGDETQADTVLDILEAESQDVPYRYED